MNMGNNYRLFKLLCGQRMNLYSLSGCLQLLNFDYLDNHSFFHPHGHPFYELLYVLEGSVRVLIDGQLIELSSQDILSIPGGTKHLIIQERHPFSVVCTHFQFLPHSDKSIERMAHLSCLKEYIDDEIYLLDNFKKLGPCRTHDEGPCQNALDSLADCIRQKNIAGYICLANLILNYHFIAFQKFVSSVASVEAIQDKIHTISLRLSNPAIEIQNYIHENCMKPITIDGAAADLNYSKRQIQRILMEYYESSFLDILRHARISYLMELLMSEKLSQEELAYRCGYNSVQQMNSQFKMLTGMTVTQYRQSVSSTDADRDDPVSAS